MAALESSRKDNSALTDDACDRFSHFHLQQEYDIQDPNEHCHIISPLKANRSKIYELVSAHGIVFALTRSGLCAALCRETNQRICFLNHSPDEVIRSLFYNKYNDSLITVSLYPCDNFSGLKCRTTRIEDIKRGSPEAGIAIFESDSLKWPGFVEFDDINGKVVTYVAQDSVYKVYDMKTYGLLYSITDKIVEEIKISSGVMLLILAKSANFIPLKLLSIEDGTVLKSLNHFIRENKTVDFIELFNQKLLLKQENENLQILDVHNFELIEVSKTDFVTPSSFIFLHEKQLFVTLRNRTASVWNIQGELITSFEDHLIWSPDCNPNYIYITNDHSVAISYCKVDLDDPLSAVNAGSINVINILNGECLAKIKADNCSTVEENSNCSNISCSNSSKMSKIWSTPAEALNDITALYYDEERNEIYTGNRRGLVHVWSHRLTTMVGAAKL